MQLLFDVNRSIKENPPEYGDPDITGIEFIERKIDKLSNLRIEDRDGISLQPREKSIEDAQRELEHSFRMNGVLYEKQVMVAELCDDGVEELISGYGRKRTFDNMGVKTYFYDLIKYRSPYIRAIDKRRRNALADHIAKGVPNTQGTYIQSDNAFNDKNDDAIRLALLQMSNNQLSEKQVENLLTKYRKSNSKYIGITAYDKIEANKAAEELELPTSGYVRDISSKAFDTTGWVYRTGDLKKEVISWAEKYDNYGEKIKITGYIEHTDLDEETIQKARKVFEKALNKTIKDVIKKYFDVKYHDMVEFQGFLAQITTPDIKQNGKRKERGLVDVDGNIIKE